MSVTWAPGPRNSKPEPVEFYRTPEETLFESGELPDAIKELACLLFSFVVIAAIYWWF